MFWFDNLMDRCSSFAVQKAGFFVFFECTFLVFTVSWVCQGLRLRFAIAICDPDFSEIQPISSQHFDRLTNQNGAIRFTEYVARRSTFSYSRLSHTTMKCKNATSMECQTCTLMRFRNGKGMCAMTPP